jgi:hypothetical protein
MNIWSWKKSWLMVLCGCGIYLVAVADIWWLFGWEIADIPTKTLYFGLIVYQNWLWIPVSTLYLVAMILFIGRLNKWDLEKFHLNFAWSLTLSVILLFFWKETFNTITEMEDFLFIFLWGVTFVELFYFGLVTQDFDAPKFGVAMSNILVSGLSFGLFYGVFSSGITLVLFLSEILASLSETTTSNGSRNK